MDKISPAVLEGMVSMLRKMREDVVPKNNGNREYHAYCTAITAISAIIKIKRARMGTLVK